MTQALDIPRAILLALAAACAIAHAGPAPEFREILSAEEFEGRLKQFQSEVDVDAAVHRARTHPTGILIYRLTPDGQADDAGLEAGDYILTINGAELNSYGNEWSRDEDARKLVYRPAEGGATKSVTLSSGSTGTWYQAEIPGLRDYVGALDDGMSPDPLILAAILAVEEDAALAETAMHRALASGYAPGPVSDAVGIAAALRTNRPAVAWAFAEHLMEARPELPAEYRMIVTRAAFASGQFLWLHDLDKRFPNVLWADDYLEPDSVTKWLAERTIENRPSARRSELGLRSRFHDVKMVTENIRSPRKWPPRRNITFSDTTKQGYWARSLYRIEGGLKQVIWEMEFQTRRTSEPMEEGRERWGNVARFTLHSVGEDSKLKATLGGVELESEPTGFSLRTLGVGMNESASESWASLDPERRVKLTFLLVGDEMEIQMNGSTVLWMPCTREFHDLGFNIFVSGMDIDIHNTRVYEVIGGD